MATDIADESAFDDHVLGSDLPVLVDFWAEWCAPCRLVAPELEALAEEMKGRIEIAKVDIDSNPAIASRYGIMSIPTVMLFNGGKPVGSSVGAKPRQAISADLGLEDL